MELGAEIERLNAKSPFFCWCCWQDYNFSDLDKIGEGCSVCGKSIDEIEKIWASLDDPLPIPSEHVKQMIEFIRCEMEKVLEEYVGEDNTRFTRDAINKKLSGVIETYCGTR